MAKKREPKPRKGSWIVRMRIVEIIDIVTTDCTEEQARNYPHDHIEDGAEETHIETTDWEVLSVKPNE